MTSAAIPVVDTRDDGSSDSENETISTDPEPPDSVASRHVANDDVRVQSEQFVSNQKCCELDVIVGETHKPIYNADLDGGQKSR